MKKYSFVQGLCSMAIVGIAIACLGCDGSDGNGGPETIGSSTIIGIVESFEGSSVSAGVFVGAVREGIRVRVLGTGLSTTTADDGLFVISGVPAGLRTLRFEYRSDAAEYRLNVPEQAELMMNRIRIRNREVMCDPIQVRREPSPDAPDMEMGGDGVLDRDRIRLSQ